MRPIVSPSWPIFISLLSVKIRYTNWLPFAAIGHGRDVFFQVRFQVGFASVADYGFFLIEAHRLLVIGASFGGSVLFITLSFCGSV
jgi:hypothetical protein